MQTIVGRREAEEAPPGLYVYLPGSIFHHSTATQTDGVKRNSKNEKKNLWILKNFSWYWSPQPSKMSAGETRRAKKKIPQKSSTSSLLTIGRVRLHGHHDQVDDDDEGRPHHGHHGRSQLGPLTDLSSPHHGLHGDRVLPPRSEVHYWRLPPPGRAGSTETARDDKGDPPTQVDT